MAFEAVVFAQDPFAYACGDQYFLCHSLGDLPVDERSSSSSMFGLLDDVVDPNPNSSSPETCRDVAIDPCNMTAGGGGGGGGGGVGRKKRRRSRSGKNKEEMENQRMTHIAVERNRRKQMNEYLGVLRTLMPPSYSQRGDQASIIGGTINFVKELEHLLQSMESHKRTNDQPSSGRDDNDDAASMSSTPPFADFFTFPQYSTRSAENPVGSDGRRRAVADIEVNMVESHANIKVLVKKRPRQLLKLVAGLQNMRLIILHLNVTTLDDSVLYSSSVKVEEGCHLISVDEIAAAVHNLLRKMEEEAGFLG